MDEHLAPCQPRPAIDDEPAHFPRRIVEQIVDDSSDPAVVRLDREALQRGNDLQHGIAPFTNGSEGPLSSQFENTALAYLTGPRLTASTARIEVRRADQFSCALTKRKIVSAKSDSKRMRARRIAENAASWCMEPRSCVALSIARIWGREPSCDHETSPRSRFGKYLDVSAMQTRCTDPSRCRQPLCVRRSREASRPGLSNFRRLFLRCPRRLMPVASRHARSSDWRESEG